MVAAVAATAIIPMVANAGTYCKLGSDASNYTSFPGIGVIFSCAAQGAMLDLQPQIDAAAAKGGGTVCVPPGEHEVMPFELKSNVTLQLADGAKLLASTNIADYAADLGARCFIYAENATNVAVVGKGVLDGRGGVFREM